MKAVIKLAQDGIIKPFIGGEFKVAQMAEAHEYLESRKSMGKIVVKW